MVAKKLKCYWCNEKDYDENMETVQQGSQKKDTIKKIVMMLILNTKES